MNNREPNKKQDMNKLKGVLIPVGVIVFFNLMAIGGNELGDSAAVIVIALFLAVFVGVFVLAMRSAKNGGAAGVTAQKFFEQLTKEQSLKRGSEGEHSHDRLQLGNSAELCEDDATKHWRKQLDGFMEAGIIDRNEYQTLLERYKK